MKTFFIAAILATPPRLLARLIERILLIYLPPAELRFVDAPRRIHGLPDTAGGGRNAAACGIAVMTRPIENPEVRCERLAQRMYPARRSTLVRSRHPGGRGGRNRDWRPATCRLPTSPGAHWPVRPGRCGRHRAPRRRTSSGRIGRFRRPGIPGWNRISAVHTILSPALPDEYWEAPTPSLGETSRFQWVTARARTRSANMTDGLAVIQEALFAFTVCVFTGAGAAASEPGIFSVLRISGRQPMPMRGSGHEQIDRGEAVESITDRLQAAHDSLADGYPATHRETSTAF